MIHLLLDMGVSQSTAAHLRARGHDVVHLGEVGLERLSDRDIVAKAEDERRTIVTHDLDFGRIVALGGQSVPSVITLRLRDMRPSQVNAALDHVFSEASGLLSQGALVSVTDSGMRVRSLSSAAQ